MAKREKRASWFKLFLHQKPLMDAVPDATLGKAIKAVMTYFDTGALVDLDPLENAVFSSLKPYVDESISDYLQNIENGRKGGRPKAKPPVSPGNPPLPRLTEAEAEAEADAQTDTESMCLPAGKPPGHTRFVPPKVEDVHSYCLEKGYHVDPRRFVDYYTSTGWCVGKSPMKDWKAAVRNWSNKEKDHEKTEYKPTWTVGTQL